MSETAKPAELRNHAIEELRVLAKEEYQNLFNLRMQMQTEQLTSPAAVARSRRKLARLKTIIREKEIQLERASR
jgi:large subunit ribosomal protein L29